MTEYLQQGLYLILVLGTLVFFHELGHFLAAKLFGVRVETFSLGFGPRLFGFRRGDTDYRVAAIPLGGYVKMAGEYSDEGEDEGAEDPALLNSKPRWQRLIISAAGPVANVVLTVGLYWGLFMVGSYVADFPPGPPLVESVQSGSPAEQAGIVPGDRILAVGQTAVDNLQTYRLEVLFHPNQSLLYSIEREGQRLELEVHVGKDPVMAGGTDGVGLSPSIAIREVMPDSPAFRAGMQVGDLLVAIDERPVFQVDDFIKYVKARPDHLISMAVERNGERIVLEVTPAVDDAGVSRIGVALGWARRFVQHGPVEALGVALETTWENVELLFRTLSALFHRDLGMDAVSGPLEIARISKQQAEYGWRPLVGLMAFISINLGVFNLLPIPILDGGTILMLLIESTLRREISPLVKERILQVGFVLLIVFAATVITMDVRKAFRASSADQTESPEKPENTAQPVETPAQPSPE